MRKSGFALCEKGMEYQARPRQYPGVKYREEGGFVLVRALVILVVLVVVGISATTSTIFELQTSGADRTYRETFYRADAGTELGIQLTFENAVCETAASGFTDHGYGTDGVKIGDNIVVSDAHFAAKKGTTGNASDTDRQIVYFTDSGLVLPDYSTYSGSSSTYNALEHTNLKIGGKTGPSVGAGLQMDQGYEGLGGGTPGGGAHKIYTVNSQHVGKSNSETVIEVLWRLSIHLLNSASTSDCNY